MVRQSRTVDRVARFDSLFIGSYKAESDEDEDDEMDGEDQDDDGDKDGDGLEVP